MGALKLKRIKANIPSQDEQRILTDILKQLLGPGLVATQCHRKRKVQKSFFLKDALDSKTLNEPVI